DEIAAATGAKQPILVNDFAAVARALPVLAGDDLIHFGGTEPLDLAPKVVLGPGTGLGVAGLVPDVARNWTVVAGEGGHADLVRRQRRRLHRRRHRPEMGRTLRRKTLPPPLRSQGPHAQLPPPHPDLPDQSQRPSLPRPRRNAEVAVLRPLPDAAGCRTQFVL